MNRRVEMRAGMFAYGKIVPIPGDAPLVITGDLLDLEWGTLPKIRWQDQSRRFGRQGLRQIDNADSSGGNIACEFAEDTRCHALISQITARTFWQVVKI